MSRILVVDDEARIRQIIRKYAEFEGFEVEEAVDGMQAIEICRKEDFDLIIMDVMMPELDGFSACREIRKFKKTPIIMLSARGEEFDRIHGFETGADDYVVKPFSPKELMCRVRVVVQRNSIITNVWGYDYYGDDRTFDTHIKRLRSSLEEYRSCIVTLRGVGYRFDDHI